MQHLIGQSWHSIKSDKLLGSSSYKNTVHEVEVIQMLEACELHDKIKVSYVLYKKCRR